MNTYARTFYKGGGQAIHLVIGVSDLSICGQDVVGDDEIYSRDPECFNVRMRVTCVACKGIIKACLEHAKKGE